MKITEFAYVHGLFDSALSTLKLVKENINECDLNEEEKAEFQSYMDESLCEFISEEEGCGCGCGCEECTCTDDQKDKIIKHLSETIVMLTEQAHAE